MAKGKLIVFEGIDNCGKDTVMTHLNYYLKTNNKLVKVIPSITNTPLGRLIRTIINNTSEMRPNNLQLVPMFIADFYSKLDIVEEYLNMGYIVLCNRWYTSTLAYCDNVISQVAINGLIHTNIKPDILFYLDIRVKESISRGRESGKQVDMYGNKFILEQAKYIYDRVLTDELNTVTIDAEFPLKYVIKEIKSTLKDKGVINARKR